MSGRQRLAAIVGVLVLNAALSFANVWPTLLVKPEARLAPELVLIWSALLLACLVTGRSGRSRTGLLAALFLALVIGRYVDVTVPALFGRPLNLYWDGLQIPRLLMTASRGIAPWLLLPAIAALLLLLVGAYGLFRWAFGIVTRDLVPAGARSPHVWMGTVAALVLVAANYAGVTATWPYLSKPVLPTYARQANLLLTAVFEDRLARVLPASPALDSDLKMLAGADVELFFLESYGATVFDNPAYAKRVSGSLDALQSAIDQTGRHAVSAVFRSPTFGGGTELAHLTMLSGIDLSDPFRHDLLLTTRRPNLLSMFKSRGYQTFGLYASVSWEWVERAYYDYDVFIDGRDLQYRGPKIGLWWIPDQFAIARFRQMHPIGAASPPRLVIYPTINTHIPFRPIPPYQPDWDRVLSDNPFEQADVDRALLEKPSDWTGLGDAYARSVAYTYDWLAGYLRQPAKREFVLILVGDHQPAAIVSGDGARWDVPVHVIGSNRALLERFTALGFVPGLTPATRPLGGLAQFTAMLRDVFDSAPVSAPVNAPVSAPVGAANSSAATSGAATAHK